MNNPAFPLYVCLDDGEIMRIESLDKILDHLEAIDIENDEYLFWDATGNGLKIGIQKGRVSGFENAAHPITLQQAFDAYAKQLGAALDTAGKPEDIWANVQRIKERLPRRRGLLSKLFGGTRA